MWSANYHTHLRILASNYKQYWNTEEVQIAAETSVLRASHQRVGTLSELTRGNTHELQVSATIALLTSAFQKWFISINSYQIIRDCGYFQIIGRGNHRFKGTLSQSIFWIIWVSFEHMWLDCVFLSAANAHSAVKRESCASCLCVNSTIHSVNADSKHVSIGHLIHRKQAPVHDLSKLIDSSWNSRFQSSEKSPKLGQVYWTSSSGWKGNVFSKQQLRGTTTAMEGASQSNIANTSAHRLDKETEYIIDWFREGSSDVLPCGKKVHERTKHENPYRVVSVFLLNVLTKSKECKGVLGRNQCQGSGYCQDSMSTAALLHLHGEARLCREQSNFIIKQPKIVRAHIQCSGSAPACNGTCMQWVPHYWWSGHWCTWIFVLQQRVLDKAAKQSCELGIWPNHPSVVAKELPQQRAPQPLCIDVWKLPWMVTSGGSGSSICASTTWNSDSKRAWWAAFPTTGKK